MAPPIIAFKSRHHALLTDPDTIDLSQAVPAYAPPPPVLSALRSSAGDPTARTYTVDPGRDDARASVAEHLARRHEAGVAPENILLTPGANAAFHFAATTLCDAGDTVWLLAPYYFNHAMSLDLLDVTTRLARLPLEVDVTRALASGALDAIPAGDTLVVVNPSNPTGRSLNPDEWGALVSWARDRSVRLIVDETYLEFYPPGAPSVTALASKDWDRDTVVVGSFSKSLAMAGDRIGYLAAHPQVLDEALKVQDSAAVCANHAAQLAVRDAFAWPDLGAWLDERRAEMNTRVAACRASAAEGGVDVIAAGAFFAYAALPPGVSADDAAREAKVLTLPGAAFGDPDPRHIRIAVGNADEDDIRRAMGRMSQLPSR